MNTQDTIQVRELPVFPLRNTLLFPFMVGPFSAGRRASIAAIEAALASEDKLLLVVAQRDAGVEEPRGDDLFTVGTKAVIKRMARSE
ncbi:MAG: LON peptidase substrate-binding domain-containing protein, partial [Chromatiaceae bacterium]